MPQTADAARIRRLPKVLLHEHLDGSLRVRTLLELLKRRGIPSPADTEAGLAAWFDARANAGSLDEYLRGFALTVAAMAELEALRRVAFQAAEDAREEGAVLAEFRIAPLLFEAHGLQPDAVVDALVDGLGMSTLPCGLIVCAMRDLPEAQTIRAAQLALRWQGKGVIGFDLAGAEAGHPPGRHRRAIKLARDAGLPLTLHAGEADVPERVVEALRLGAARIGHGVRLIDALRQPPRRVLLDEVIDNDIHLEVCPTSNVHTGAFPSIAQHPITELWRAGVSLSWHTDNRLMSRITQTSEAVALLEQTTLTEEDLLQMGLKAAEKSFLAAEHKADARKALLAWRHVDALLDVPDGD